MPEAKTCGAPECDAPPSESPRRFVVVALRGGGERRLHVCRNCHDRWKANGTFKHLGSRWSEIEAEVVEMRREGRSIAEIVRAFPGLPRRTAYAICTRNGLAGVRSYEVGQGGHRGVPASGTELGLEALEDPALAALVEVWPALAPELRKAILRVAGIGAPEPPG